MLHLIFWKFIKPLTQFNKILAVTALAVIVRIKHYAQCMKCLNFYFNQRSRVLTTSFNMGMAEKEY